MQRVEYTRYLIDEMTVPISSNDIDVHESEIALGLTVTDEHQWYSNDSNWVRTHRTFHPFKVRL